LGQTAVIRNQDDGALTSRQQILQKRGGRPNSQGGRGGKGYGGRLSSSKRRAHRLEPPL